MGGDQVDEHVWLIPSLWGDGCPPVGAAEGKVFDNGVDAVESERVGVGPALQSFQPACDGNAFAQLQA